MSFQKMNREIRTQISSAFEEFVDRGQYILGPKVAEFERAFASYCQTSYCVGVASGLDALVIALKTLKIGKNDEVIVPTNTYIATWLSVSMAGAVIVPVEPNRKTYNIDAAGIQEKITPRTRAVIPVHLYGQCCEMDGIMNAARAHGIYVIEDNAQAQGASYRGKTSGSFGDINATSFYPAKNLGAFGDAGAMTTNDEKLYREACLIRNYGSKEKYLNDLKGLNSRLDELQAALLDIKLKRLNEWNQERIAIADLYRLLLAGVGDLVLPETAGSATAVYHLYVIRTARRNALQKYLLENGIGTMIHYPVPPHLQKAYSDLNYRTGDFPVAEEIANTCLSLPIYPGLKPEETSFIADTVKNFFSGR